MLGWEQRYATTRTRPSGDFITGRMMYSSRHAMHAIFVLQSCWPCGCDPRTARCVLLLRVSSYISRQVGDSRAAGGSVLYLYLCVRLKRCVTFCRLCPRSAGKVGLKLETCQVLRAACVRVRLCSEMSKCLQLFKQSSSSFVHW